MKYLLAFLLVVEIAFACYIMAILPAFIQYAGQ